MEKIVWAMLQRFIIPKNITIFFVTDISESGFHLPGEREVVVCGPAQQHVPESDVYVRSRVGETAHKFGLGRPFVDARCRHFALSFVNVKGKKR